MNEEQAKVIFGDRQRAYQLALKEAAGKAVLLDLAIFCRENETCVAAINSTAPIDVYRTFLLEGRREVLLRIQDHLKLSVEELVQKYTVQAASE